MYICYLLIIIIAILINYNKFSKGSEFIIEFIWFVLFIIIGTFAFFTDDYEPYENIILEAYVNPLAHFHIEPIWISLAGFCKGNITEFRFISFCLISMSIIVLSYLSHVKLKNFLLYYSLLCLGTHLCWMRQPLAMLVFFIGFFLLVKKKYLIAVFVMASTLLIHKVGIIMLLLVPFIFVPINKRTMAFLMFSTPILSIFIFSIVALFNEQFTNIFIEYSEADGRFDDRNIIYTIFYYITLFSNIILLAYSIFKYKDSVSGTYKYLLRYLLGVTFLTIFLVMLPIQTDMMSTRTLSISNISLILILSKYHTIRLKYLKYDMIIWILLLMTGVRELSLITNNYVRINRLLRPIF